MNDVDTDQHRHTLAGEEGPLGDPGTHPDHVHNAAIRAVVLVMHVILQDISKSRGGCLPLMLEGLKCLFCIRA